MYKREIFDEDVVLQEVLQAIGLSSSVTIATDRFGTNIGCPLADHKRPKHVDNVLIMDWDVRDDVKAIKEQQNYVTGWMNNNLGKPMIIRSYNHA